MNQIRFNHRSLGMQEAARRPLAGRSPRADGIGAASRWLVALVLLGLAVGCAPWSTPRRLPAPELKAPTDSGTNARPTHHKNGKPNDVDLPGMLGLGDAAAQSLPRAAKFQFTNQDTQVEPDRGPITNTFSNTSATALTPKNHAFASSESIVRVEPQLLDEHIQMVGFEQVVEDVAQESNSASPQVDTTTLPPSGTPIEGSGSEVADARDAPTAETFEAPTPLPVEPSDETQVMESSAIMPTPDEPRDGQVAIIRQGAQACIQLALASCSADAVAPESELPTASEEPSGTASGMSNGQLRQLIRDMMAGASQSVEAPTHSSDSSEYLHLRDELVALLNQQLAMMDELQSTDLDPAERKYWRLQSQALINLLNASQESPTSNVPRQAVIDAVDCLRQAIKEMEAMASLNIPRAEFCTEVRGFGQYESLKENVVQCGQPLLIYCELENYISKPTTVGDEAWFATRLRSRLVVRDPLGRIVQRAEFPLVEDLARNQRNDFYLHIPFTVGELRTGSYRLDLVVEDIEGNKTACYQPGLTFRVR